MGLGEHGVGETVSDDALDLLASVTPLLADKTLATRVNRNRISGEKFPVAVLSLKTPDYDVESGTGVNLFYHGTIDRATHDAMNRDPMVTFEGEGSRVDVPVVRGSRMVFDQERFTENGEEQRMLVVRLAGNLLDGLGVVRPIPSNS